MTKIHITKEDWIKGGGVIIIPCYKLGIDAYNCIVQVWQKVPPLDPASSIGHKSYNLAEMRVSVGERAVFIRKPPLACEFDGYILLLE